MTKWEYRHVPAGYGTWDAIGQEGWELVGFDPNGRAHFKRPIAVTKEEFERLMAGTQINEPKTS